MTQPSRLSLGCTPRCESDLRQRRVNWLAPRMRCIFSRERSGGSKFSTPLGESEGGTPVPQPPANRVAKIDRQNSGFSEAGSGTVHPWKPRWGAPSRKLAPVRCTLSEAGSGTVHPLGSRSRTRFDDEKYLSLASQPPAPSPQLKSTFSLTPSSPYCSPSQLLIKKDPFVFTPKRWSPGYFPRGDNVPLSGSWILRFEN